jgi:transposase
MEPPVLAVCGRSRQAHRPAHLQGLAAALGRLERTFGWLGRYRRLNRDYERQAQTGETMVHLAMIRLMLARLNRA